MIESIKISGNEFLFFLPNYVLFELRQNHDLHAFECIHLKEEVYTAVQIMSMCKNLNTLPFKLKNILHLLDFNHYFSRYK